MVMAALIQHMFDHHQGISPYYDLSKTYKVYKTKDKDRKLKINDDSSKKMKENIKMT
jgi:peptide deformylase